MYTTRGFIAPPVVEERVMHSVFSQRFPKSMDLLTEAKKYESGYALLPKEPSSMHPRRQDIVASGAMAPSISPCPILSPGIPGVVSEAAPTPRKGLKDMESYGKNSPGPSVFEDSSINLSRITNGNTTLEDIDPSKSSLNFSLSPSSALHGMDFVETCSLQEGLFGSTELEDIRPPPPPPQRLQSIAEGERMTSNGMLSYRNSSQYVDTVGKKKKNTNHDLVCTTRDRVKNAHSKMNSSTLPYHNVRPTQDEAKMFLEKERTALRKKDLEARKEEERLHQKISELQVAMARDQERSRLVVGAEKCLRLRREKDISDEKERTTQLNKKLKEAKESLEDIKRYHKKFETELIQAVGGSEIEMRTLSQEDFMTGITGKIRSIIEKNEVLTEQVQQMFHTPTGFSDEIERLGKRLQEHQHSNSALQVENSKLNQQIAELSEEVASSRAYIDQLLRSSHESLENEWGLRESQYKSVITNLRHELGNQAPSISLDLYKAAVTTGKQHQENLVSAEQKVASLQSQLKSFKLSQRQFTPPKSCSPTLTAPGFFSPTELLETGQLSKNTAKKRIQYDFHKKKRSAIALPVGMNSPSPMDAAHDIASATKKKHGLEDLLSRKPRKLSPGKVDDFPPLVKESKAGLRSLTGMTITFSKVLACDTEQQLSKTPGPNAGVKKPQAISPLSDTGDVLDLFASPIPRKKLHQQGSTADDNTKKQAGFLRKKQLLVAGRKGLNRLKNTPKQKPGVAGQPKKSTPETVEEKENLHWSGSNNSPKYTSRGARQHILQKHGGRKGLQQKVKSIRSPPPRYGNTSIAFR